MCAFVLSHVDEFRGFLNAAKGGFHRSFGTADKGHDRPVGTSTGIDIEQGNAICRFNCGRNLSNNIEIAPLRKIGDAFDEFLHDIGWNYVFAFESRACGCIGTSILCVAANSIAFE